MLDFNTRFRAVSNIRQFFRWTMSEHLAANNPCRKIGIPFPPEKVNELFRYLYSRGVAANA